MRKTILFMAAGLMLASCGGNKPATGPQLFESQAFDTVLNGEQVKLYTLANESGMTVQITNYGARIVDLWVPAADGSYKDVVMGFENIAAYLAAKDVNNGPVVGRYGNRIGKGQFTLDGASYQLSINDGENHLHGGTGGFGSKVWSVAPEGTSPSSLTLSYTSADGEEGYPGQMTLVVTYSLTEDNSLSITYSATAQAPTILNPTSHSYFNLHGTNSLSTNSHVMQINASRFTPTDAGLIPTGEIVPVEKTPLDFKLPTLIGERIGTDFEPLKFGKGYDHNWVLDKAGEPGAVELAATVWEPSTGIGMEVWTDQPGLQFYSGNFMDGSETGKRGEVNNYRSGIALETQNFPDAPNHADFPSAVLRPGGIYSHVCIYKFFVQK